MSAETQFPIWNGWTSNYLPKEDGYILHAWEEKPRKVTRALCGVKIQDTGLIQLGEDGWMPGCMRCRAILRKRGLLVEHD